MRSSAFAFLLALGCARALDAEPPAPAPAAAPAADVAALAKDLAGPDLDARRKAAYALWGLFDKGAPALPALAKALADDDEYVRTTAEKAFLKIAPFAMGRPEFWSPAFAALRPLLADTRPSLRRTAAMALWSLGAVSEGADALFETAFGLLSDPDADLRANGAGILANAAPWLKPAHQPLRDRAVSALLPLAADKDDRVRRSVADALGSLGMPEGMPPLFTLAEDPVAGVRAAALPALGGLAASDEESERRLTLLRAALFEADPLVRASAANTLWVLGPSATGASADLQKVLREDPEPSVRAPAVSALGAGGERSTIGAVRRAADDADPSVRSAAVNALADFGPDAAPFLPFLVQQLGEDDAGRSVSAAMTIGRLGSVAGPALPALLKALTAGTANTRRLAANALHALAWAEALPDDVVPAIVAAFARADGAFRYDLAAVLATLPRLPAEAGPALRAAYVAAGEAAALEPGGRSRALLITALTRVVGPPEETLTLLRPVAGAEDDVPRQAALALVVLGTADDRARGLDLLQRRMTGPDGLSAVLFLQWAGRHARPAAAALAERFRALRDTTEDRPVRHLLAGALARIGGEHAAEAVEFLRREVVAGDNPTVAASAAETLGAVESPPPAVVEALVACLEDLDGSAELAVAACRALRRIGHSDARTLALLARAAEHPRNGALRLAAGHALLVLAGR